MNKAFTPFTWKNEPSQDTPLSESMLNRINTGLDVVDNRVITMDTTKADKSEIYSVISGVSLDNETGIFTFHRLNGTTFTVDTKLEKIITNFTYDRNTQTLHLHLEDGTDMPVDISSFITNVEFTDSETIRHEAGADGTVSFEVIDGSITENKLEPNYLANIKLSESTAKLHAADALESSREAELSAQRAEKAADEATAAAGGDYLPRSGGVAENLSIGGLDDLGGEPGAKLVDSSGNVRAILSFQDGEFYYELPDGEQWTILDANNFTENINLSALGGATLEDLDARIAVIPEEEGGGFKVNSSLIAYDTLAVMASSEDAASAIGGLDHYGQLMWALMGMGSDLGWMDYAYNVHTILDTNNFKSNITPSAIGAASTADLAKYLPLSGGTITDKVTTPLKINTTDANTYSLIGYFKNGTKCGEMGFDGVNTPVVYLPSGGRKVLHHDGNSAKVAIQSSAPTDTSSLWVY